MKKTLPLVLISVAGLFLLTLFLRPHPESQSARARESAAVSSQLGSPAPVSAAPSSQVAAHPALTKQPPKSPQAIPLPPRTSSPDSKQDTAMLSRWQLGTSWGRERDPELAAFSTWTGQYLAAAPADRDAMVAEGTKLAQSRRAALLELIAAEPQEALAAAVPFAVRERLPAAITRQLEERVSGKGDFEVLATVAGENQPKDSATIIRRAVIEGKQFTAHVYGARKNQRTTANISLHGVAVEGHLALSESPVRVLEPGEPLNSARPSSDPTCSVSGQKPANTAGPGLLAASGNQVHWLCEGGHLRTLESMVQAAEGGTTAEGVAATAYQSVGSKKILLMLVDFDDIPGGPVSVTDARASLDDVTAFLGSNSFNQLQFSVRDVTPVLRMPRTGSSYSGSNDPYSLLTDARNAAALAGFDPANYEFDVVAFSWVGFYWSGLGFVGAKGSWIQGNFHRGVTAHELGHNLGNWHANSWVSSTIIGLGGTHSEYGNPFDVMGNAWDYPRNHYSANFKFLYGWLPNTSLHTVTASGTYRIFAQDFGGNLKPSRRYGIRIPVGIVAGGESMDYWIDFRQGNDGYSTTESGAVLQWGNDAGTPSASRLLDTQPGTLGYMGDAPLAVGRTFRDAQRSLAITTLAKGTMAGDPYLDIQITFAAIPAVPVEQALDWSESACITGGNSPWTGQIILDHDGADAAASGAIGDSQESYLETTITGPGTLNFWWMVSSEADHDSLSFLVDGLVQEAISGESSWQYCTYFLPAGSHALRWRYAKDAAGAAGADQGWVDQVSFTPGSTPPLIIYSPFSYEVTVGESTRFTVSANGTPPLSYQWRKDGSPIPDAVDAAYAITEAQISDAGVYDVIVSSPYGSVTSDAANLIVSDLTPVPLGNNVPVVGLAAALYNRRFFKITVPSSQDSLRIAISNGSGNCDLYVRHGSPPTWFSWDYSPFLDGNNESVVIPTPGAGDWYIMLFASTPYSGVQLLVRYESETPLITTQPQSVVATGPADVRFSVEVACSTPVRYQWRRDGINLTDNSKVSGANTSTLLLTGATKADAGTYSVTVASDRGRVDSGEALLRMMTQVVLQAPVKLPGGQFRVRFGDASGSPFAQADAARFEVQASTDLVHWVVLETPLTITGGFIETTDDESPELPHRFYRTVEH